MAVARSETVACERCQKPFSRNVKTGQYVRRYCTKVCAMKRHGTTEERFWEKTDKNAPGGCWIWTGAVNNWGYGKFYEDATHINAHKWAYQHWVGQVPPGKVLRHTCDIPRCVNPAHMVIGTCKDNSRDSYARNRRTHLKLTEDKVREIRKLLGEGKVKWKQYETLGKLMGLDAQVIYLAHVRRTWKWVA